MCLDCAVWLCIVHNLRCFKKNFIIYEFYYWFFERIVLIYYGSSEKEQCALIAQLDRVTGYEPVGRGFESLSAHQKIKRLFRQSLYFYPIRRIGMSSSHKTCMFLLRIDYIPKWISDYIHFLAKMITCRLATDWIGCYKSRISKQFPLCLCLPRTQNEVDGCQTVLCLAQMMFSCGETILRLRRFYAILNTKR